MQPERHIFKREAMYTQFEVQIAGEDATYARQAADEDDSSDMEGHDAEDDDLEF